MPAETFSKKHATPTHPLCLAYTIVHPHCSTRDNNTLRAGWAVHS